MTEKITQGQPIPNFSFNATNGLSGELKNYSGKIIVVYFYPKDNTPGCTNESKAFRDLYPEFQKVGVEIFGVSRDSLASHEKFKQKYELPFELISDPDETLCNLFEVIRPKVMFGKSLIGLIRSTFVIDKNGNLAKAWRKVKVKGHAEEVFEYVNSLK